MSVFTEACFFRQTSSEFLMQIKNMISDHTCSVAADSRMLSCFLLFLPVAQQGWSKVPGMLSEGAQRRSGRPNPAAGLGPVRPSLSSVHNVVSLRSEPNRRHQMAFSLTWSWTQQDCTSHQLIGQLVLTTDVMFWIKGSTQSFTYLPLSVFRTSWSLFCKCGVPPPPATKPPWTSL